jgi:hypothetical protein
VTCVHLGCLRGVVMFLLGGKIEKFKMARKVEGANPLF